MDYESKASQLLNVPEERIKRVKVRYRAGNGHLINEPVYVDRKDIMSLVGLQTITHDKQLRKSVRNGYVRAYVPSRHDVRTFSARTGKVFSIR